MGLARVKLLRAFAGFATCIAVRLFGLHYAVQPTKVSFLKGVRPV